MDAFINEKFPILHWIQFCVNNLTIPFYLNYGIWLDQLLWNAFILIINCWIFKNLLICLLIKFFCMETFVILVGTFYLKTLYLLYSTSTSILYLLKYSHTYLLLPRTVQYMRTCMLQQFDVVRVCTILKCYYSSTVYSILEFYLLSLAVIIPFSFDIKQGNNLMQSSSWNYVHYNLIVVREYIYTYIHVQYIQYMYSLYVYVFILYVYSRWFCN